MHKWREKKPSYSWPWTVAKMPKQVFRLMENMEINFQKYSMSSKHSILTRAAREKFPAPK